MEKKKESKSENIGVRVDKTEKDDDNDDAGQFSLVHRTSKKKTPLPISTSSFWTSSILFRPTLTLQTTWARSHIRNNRSGTISQGKFIKIGWKPCRNGSTILTSLSGANGSQSNLRGSGGKPKKMVETPTCHSLEILKKVVEPPTCQPRDDNINITSITHVVILNEQESSQGSGGNPKLLVLTLLTPPPPLTTTSKVQVQPLSITTHVEDLSPPSLVTLQLSNVLVDLEKTYVHQSPLSSTTTTQSQLTTTTSGTQLTTSLIQRVFNDLPFVESKKLMVARMTNQPEFQELVVKKVCFLKKRREFGFDSKKDEVVPRVEDVFLVDRILEGAFGGDGDDDFAIGDEAMDSEEEEAYDEDDEE
nr:hypothetical protein [Tanacetum cinerariifolium]